MNVDFCVFATVLDIGLLKKALQVDE